MKTPLRKRIADAFSILLYDDYGRRRRRKYTDDEKRLMCSMAKDGMTQEEIANRFNLSRDNIKNFLTRKK